VISLVILLVIIVGVGKYLGSQQAAKQRRELAALRRELDESRREQDPNGDACRNEAP